MNFKRLSDWIMVEHCATRIVRGGNVDNIDDRVAFIEKTPRVKLNNSLRTVDYGVHHFSIECENGIGATVPEEYIGNRSIWISGNKGSTDYGKDERSREWCDEMLKALGWEVEE
jgi:hypothetical protein